VSSTPLRSRSPGNPREGKHRDVTRHDEQAKRDPLQRHGRGEHRAVSVSEISAALLAA